MNQFEQMLAKWGFKAPRGRDGKVSNEANPPEPRDPYHDVQQVKQMLLDEDITPEMILSHPYIKLSADARAYLEGFTRT